ncbi:MAG: penicillin-binding protein 2 [Gammaproteobacteria bacterium]|nr:penicillin-binding protein 2 [Gammaproteobacteria bacterium]
MVQFSRLTLKDHFRETHLFNHRILVAGAGVMVLFLALAIRIFYLQVIQHDHYSTLSEDNRYTLLPLAPTRGLIYDRNGILLAQNLPTFTLELTPAKLPNLNDTLKTLEQMISISLEDKKRFYKLIKKRRRFDSIPLRFRLSDEEVARIAVNQYRLPGVRVNAELTRHYPHGSLASHAIGYVARISEDDLQKLDPTRYAATRYVGKVGVEKAYEDILHGEVGYQEVEINAQGREVEVRQGTLPVPGKNIYLSLDLNVQRVAEQSYGDYSGALVAIDPNDGSILALVSLPTFDPNLFVNGIDTDTYQELNASPSQPLFNRALQGRYPPGSTIKPFVGLAALENNTVTPEKTIYCPGYYTLKNDDRHYRDWRKEGHGQTNLAKAITESCDVYFYDLALNLNIDKMQQFLAQFGFGKPTGVDLRDEVSGLLPSREWKLRAQHQAWYPGETIITGIGQGYWLTTPLQLANATAAIATRGHRLQPHILHATHEVGVEQPVDFTPVALPDINLKHPENWDTIINAMHNVIHGPNGTARGIGVNAKYQMAGKTGTAQVFGLKEGEKYDVKKVSKHLRDHALFIAFAPVDNPQIAVALIVENAGGGGANAAPIARKVIDAYLEEEEQDE